MNIALGGQMFVNVQIPLLWGSRAVLQDIKGRVSVIDLNRREAKIEILGDEPAPGVEYTLSVDGFEIMSNGSTIYKYNKDEKILSMANSKIPECQIDFNRIRVGGSIFSNNMIVGLGVGIAVFENGGIAVGGPIPEGLAKLIVK